MKYWITFIGSSPFAVINTIWAACKIDGFVPDKLIFLVNRDLWAGWINDVKHWVPLVISGYSSKSSEMVFHEVKETDFSTIKNAYRNYMKNLSKEDEVAIDITPGRKYMSAIAMEIGLSMNADHVYYLHLTDRQYENSPYPVIPVFRHTLIDLKKEFEETAPRGL
jgi:hypothetical protein